MIASSLIIPTERVPNSRDIKRALMSYDRVYLFSPDDRELISPQHFMPASIPIPFPVGMNMGPVKPLGKAPGYDRRFQELLDTCEVAIKQGSMIIRSTPEYGQEFFIGNTPVPEGEPNPKFVYQVYRALATRPDVVSAISRGLEHLPPMKDEEIDELVPEGKDDLNITYLPEKAMYPGFVATEEERVLLTRLSHARLGALIRSLAICQIEELQAYTTDTGVASVIQLLDKQANTNLVTMVEEDDKKNFLVRLNWLHDLIEKEFVDTKALEEMSIEEVLKLRTEAWGRAGEARSKLYNELRKFILDTPSKEIFEAQAKEAIFEYLKDKEELDREFGKLKAYTFIDLSNRIAKLSLAAIGGELAQKFLSTGSPEWLLFWGMVETTGFMKEHFKSYYDYWHKESDLQNSAGYALFRPYGPFIKQ